MSAASLPYHLRPHKAVDRRLFIDLLSRVERWKSLDSHVYLSMGAYPLEDHKMVHRLIGLKRLVAFDFDKAVVDRQRFNRPLQNCHCLQAKSGEVIQHLDKVLSDAGFADAAGLIFWLDYTDPKKIGEQIREFRALLDKLAPCDIVRVTVNAHPHELLEKTEGGRPVPAEERRASQFRTITGRIGDYLPSKVTADDMTEDRLPIMIANAFGKAALEAFPVSGDKAFRPLSVVRYADGQQMLSITGMVMARDDEAAISARLGLDLWPFASIDWDEVHHLVVPDLTLRERLFLEREVTTKDAAGIVAGLGFDVAGEVPIADFLQSYRDYYRFYPTLLTSEL